jgi:hypothetical protein
MESSPELRALTLRFYQALTAGDLPFLEQFISPQPGVLNIGSDPTEWWSGRESFIEAAKAQFQAMGSMVRVTGVDPQAYSEGPIGWVADRVTFELPDGTKIPFRLTAVFHTENGTWRLVQSHLSVGQRNEDLMSDTPG